MSTKLNLLENLVKKVDVLAVAGGIAQTFLFYEGIPMGKSLVEPGMEDVCARIKKAAMQAGCALLLPVDGVAAASPTASAQVIPMGDLPADQAYYDVGPETVERFKQALSQARTLVWNGPLGLFEQVPFQEGSEALAQEVARLTTEGSLYSVAGGGETVAVITQAGCADRLSYLSTAGGAFLEYLEGQALPGVVALEECARRVA